MLFCFFAHTTISLFLSDTVLALLRSSTTLWTMLIHDYGIISTIAAAMTLAAIGCLLFIMLRTITPRKLQSHSHHQLQQLPEKKKKKRKGQYPRGRSRIRPSSLSTTTKVIPEEESSNDGFDETPPQQQHVVAVDEPERLVLLDPVPEAREPEIVIRPRIQSYSTVESATASIDDQSTTSSVRSFGSAPTVQTTFTTNSERSGKSSVAPAFDVPMAKGKMTMSKSGKKKIALMMKKGTNLAVERGDGQLTPEYPFRSPNTTTQASKAPKSVRIIDKEYSKDFRATSSPCRSEQKPRVEGTTSRRGHARQLRANYHDPKPAPVSPLPPPIDTDSFFSAPISPYSASNLNASTAPYTPNHMPSHSLGPIGSTPPRLELSYSAPSYTQPYSQQLSPRWGTPVRPPPGLGGLLTSPSHQFGVTLYAYEQDDENLDEGDSRIEAELQELGGQMVGSILDF